MARVSNPIQSEKLTPAQQAQASIAGKRVCPFCGTVGDESDAVCPRCSMEDSAATRQATKARIGPWHVLQSRNPSAPGMRFATLLSLVRRGHVTPRSIVRGPTTHQLWRYAAKVKGLSREFNLCYSCGGEIDHSLSVCPHCNRLQDPPVDPDLLLEAPKAGARASDQRTRSSDAEPEANTPVMRSLPSAAPSEEKPVESAETSNEPEAPVEADHRSPEPISAPAVTDDAPSSEPSEPRRNRRPRTPRAPVFRELPASSTGPADIIMPSPPAGATPFGGGEGQRALAPVGELAHRTRVEFLPQATTQPSRWLAKTILLVLLLVVIGAGGILYINPAMRSDAIDWIQRTYTTLKLKISSPAEPEAPVLAPPSAADDTTPAALAAPAVNATPSAPHPAPESIVVSPAAPPVKISTPPVAPTSPPTETPAPRVTVSAAPASAGNQSFADQERTLWRAALDAEAAGDYPKAVHCYQQIKQLPKNVWPVAIDLRLEMAQRRIR